MPTQESVLEAFVEPDTALITRSSATAGWQLLPDIGLVPANFLGRARTAASQQRVCLLRVPLLPVVRYGSGPSLTPLYGKKRTFNCPPANERAGRYRIAAQSLIPGANASPQHRARINLQ